MSKDLAQHYKEVWGSLEEKLLIIAKAERDNDRLQVLLDLLDKDSLEQAGK